MKIPFFLFVALRFFVRSNISSNRSISSVNSLIAICSIFIGISVLIIGSSIMNGFERELECRFLKIIPHGEVELINPTNVNWKKEIKKINCFSNVISVSPYLDFSALMKSSIKSKIVQIRGVDLSIEEKKWLSKYIKKFLSWKNLLYTENKILIGSGIAKDINVKSGDWITLIIPNKSKNLVQQKYIDIKIGGIFNSNSQIDHNFAIVSLANAQKYTNNGNKIDGFSIKVKKIFNVEEIIFDIQKNINIPVKTYSWIKKYEYMYQDIQKIKVIIYLSCTLIIIIACVSIISSILIILHDKQISIIVFSILGANYHLIRSIFVAYGFLSGLIGNFLGIIFGTVISMNISFLFKKLEYLMGKCILSSDIYFINFFPYEIHIKDILCIAMISIFLILISSLFATLQIKKFNTVTYMKKKIRN